LGGGDALPGPMGDSAKTVLRRLYPHFEEDGMSWTDERVELLKKLWSDGLSASQIATEVRRRFVGAKREGTVDAHQ